MIAQLNNEHEANAGNSICLATIKYCAHIKKYVQKDINSFSIQQKKLSDKMNKELLTDIKNIFAKGNIDFIETETGGIVEFDKAEISRNILSDLGANIDFNSKHLLTEKFKIAYNYITIDVEYTEYDLDKT